MSADPPNPSALEAARTALYDPDLREWPAPKGVLGEPGGLAATFQAMGFRSLIREEPPEVRFEAWKSPGTAGAAFAAIVCAAIYLALDYYRVSEFRSIVAIVVVAWYIPTWLLPTWRVSGKIAHGTLSLRISSRGVLARRDRFERALRFYLTRD